MNRTCDVLVVGGGAAGVPAAVAAARGGANTVLVEKETYLGGTGYAGMFRHICGLYLNGDAAPDGTLNGGLVREIVNGLQALSEKSRLRKIGRVYVLPYTRSDLKDVLSSLCRSEKGLAVLGATEAAGVGKEGSVVRAVTVSGPGGNETIIPAMVIDCSGSGAVAARAGAESELAPPDRRQLAGFTVRVQGLTDEAEALAIKVPYHLSKAVSAGRFPPAVRFTTFSAGDSAGEGCLKISLDQEAGPLSVDDARTTARDVLAFLSAELPEFRSAKIVETSPRVLEREGRRITGEYVLTEEDVLGARKFFDGVVKNAWPVELWDKAKGTIYRYVPSGDYYEIPFRCLKAKGIANLLTAGRCISVTHEALGSTRVMGTCMALGEAAGRAAAHYVKKGKYPEY